MAAAIDRVGLGHLMGRDARELSLGERQLVLLALAVAQEAPVLLLDEPTVHLDLRHQVEAMELLRDLNERDGTALVAVLHDLGLAAHFFPRLVIIEHGRIIADGPPAEVLTDERIREMFGVEPRWSGWRRASTGAERAEERSGTLSPCPSFASRSSRSSSPWPRRAVGSSPSSGVTAATGVGGDPDRRARGVDGAPRPAEATAEPVPSDEPVETEEPAPTEEPTASEDPVATEEPARPCEPPDDAAAGEPGAADACTGSDDNRTFFEGIARAADWPVLCGVLPAGWFVSEGSYRLANGGKLLISYKGPGGATIALSEGAFCRDDDGCVPDGSELGGAALGPLDATLYQTADGFAHHRRPRGEPELADDHAGPGPGVGGGAGRGARRGRSLGSGRRATCPGRGAPAPPARQNGRHADRGLRARAVLRAVRVRRAPPPVRLGRGGLADGRPPRARGRGDRRPLARPAPGLHGGARPPAPARARSRRSTRRSPRTRSWSSAAPRRRSSSRPTSCWAPATTRSSSGRRTRASTRWRGRPART